MTISNPRIAVGIFAHNEEPGLGAFLRDLQHQELFRTEPTGSIVVLENGSTDKTAEVARVFGGAAGFGGWSYRVESLAKGGKARTWNRFVHEIAAGEEEILFFLDGDIRLPDPGLLANLLQVLQKHPEVAAAADTPVKDIVGRKGASLRERISADASSLARGDRAQLCGQCWIGRRSVLREIVLPEGILVEDGFIKAMLLTHGFRQKEDPDRFVQIAARHEFEAVTRLGPLFRHERRILLGTLVNRALFLHLHGLREAGQNPQEWLWEQHQRDPGWLAAFAAKKLREEPFFRQAGEFVHLPLTRWRGNRRPGLLPSALARLFFNYAVAWSARRAVRRGEFHW